LQERKKYIIWGIVGSIALFLTLLAYNYLKTSPLFNRSTFLTAEFESISTLRVGSVVFYYGIAVGKVQNIYLNPDNNHIMVEFDVKSGVKVPASAEAVAYVPSILYSARLELRFQNIDNQEYLESGDIIPGTIGSYILDVRDQINPYIKKADSTILALFPTKDSLQQVVKDIEATISRVASGVTGFNAALNANKGGVMSMMLQLNKLSSALNIKEDSIDLLINKLAKSTGDWRKKDLSKSIPKIHPDSFNIPNLAATNAQIVALHNRLEKMNNGQDSSLAWLLSDTLTKNNLLRKVDQIQMITTDIRLHSEQYVNIKKKK